MGKSSARQEPSDKEKNSGSGSASSAGSKTQASKVDDNSDNSQASGDKAKPLLVTPHHLTPKKSVGLAYVYFLLGGFATGAHHVYLGYHAWAIYHSLSFGFLLVGSFSDVFLIPVYVRRANHALLCHPLAMQDSAWKLYNSVMATVTRWLARAMIWILILVFVFPSIFEFVMDVDLSEGGNVLMQSPYKVLGVSKLASARELKTTYRKLSKKYHPDLNPGCDECADRMRDINNAWNKLRQRSGKSGFREDRDDQEAQRSGEEQDEESSESGEDKKSDSKDSDADSWKAYLKSIDLEAWFQEWAKDLDAKWKTLISVSTRKMEEMAKPYTKKKKAKRAKTSTEKKGTQKSSGSAKAKTDSKQSHRKEKEGAKAGGEKKEEHLKGLADLFKAYAQNDANTFGEFGYRLKNLGKEEADKLIDESMEWLMKEFDVDEDGKVAFYEILPGEGVEAYLGTMFPYWKDGFKAADLDKDGYLSASEFASFLKRLSKEQVEEFFDPVESIMNTFDNDKDGKLTIQELLQHAEYDSDDASAASMSQGWANSYHAADADKDGLLSTEEVVVFLNRVGHQDKPASDSTVKQEKEKNHATVEDLAESLKHLGEDEREKLIQESHSLMLKEFDMDEDGKVTLKEILPGDGSEDYLLTIFGQWKDSFDNADGNKDGLLSSEEFSHLLRSLGKEQLEELLDPVESIMSRFDTDKDGLISLKEILDHVNAGAETAPSGILQGWKDAFKDADANKDAHLTAEELVQLLNHVGHQEKGKRDDL